MGNKHHPSASGSRSHDGHGLAGSPSGSKYGVFFRPKVGVFPIDKRPSLCYSIGRKITRLLPIVRC